MPTAREIFGRDRALVGMVHVAALPGTPRHALPVERIVAQAVDEARSLAEAGFDALVLENMHDVPYLRREVGPEITAGMTAIAAAVRPAVSIPLGIQILAGANRAALAVAHASGCEFIRAEGFVFASVADEGLLDEADAGPLLRYRRTIGAESIAILADIRKKHASHAITADLDIASTAKAAAFFSADGVIVTGAATAEPVILDELAAVRSAVSVPVIVGSGATPPMLGDLFTLADAIIVGSWYKRDGLWSNPPDPDRVRALIEAASAHRA